MHDIEALEEAWKQYRRRKRKPYYIVALMLVTLGGGVLYYITQGLPDFFKISKNSLVKQNISTPTTISVSKKPFLLNKLNYTMQHEGIKGENKKAHLVKNGAIDSLKELPSIPTLPVMDEIPEIEGKASIENKSILHVKEKKSTMPHMKKHLTILKVSNKSAYKEVEKRFNQFHDVDDALFLARIYYANGAYKKAEAWALKTNKLNSKLEESWIIFAKSKIKLGNLDEAKHILSNYIKQSNSQEAKTLLYKISK